MNDLVIRGWNDFVGRLVWCDLMVRSAWAEPIRHRQVLPRLGLGLERIGRGLRMEVARLES